MNARIVASIALSSALAVACGANGENPSEGSSEKGPPVTQRLENEPTPLSCTAFLPAAQTTTWSAPACNQALKVNSPASYDGTMSTGGACDYFGVEWDQTTANSSNEFTASVAFQTPITDPDTCTNTTLSLAVYGFEDSANAAIYGIPGWQLLGSTTVQGFMLNGRCLAPEPDGSLGVSINVSDVVPNPGYMDLPRYLDLRVYGAIYTKVSDKTGDVTTYLPVTVGLAPTSC